MTSLWFGIIGGLVRLLLMPIINWLIVHEVINAGQTTELLANITAFLVGAAWVIWNKIKERRLLNTAIAVPDFSSLADVKSLITSNQFAPALTPEDTKPIISKGGIR